MTIDEEKALSFGMYKAVSDALCKYYNESFPDEIERNSYVNVHINAAVKIADGMFQQIFNVAKIPKKDMVELQAAFYEELKKRL